MAQLGANAYGEVLEPGRVPDCYLGLRLDPDDAEAAAVLVVAPAALLHPGVPQPDGTLLYELVTGHPDRAAVLGGGEGHGGLGVVGELLAEVLHGRPFGIIA